MKEAELRAAAECCLCHRLLGKTGMPMFYRVRIERHGINLPAMQRQHGLGLMLGGALAMAMGPDEEMTTPLMEPVTVTICEPCSTTSVIAAELAERGAAMAGKLAGSPT